MSQTTPSSPHDHVVLEPPTSFWGILVRLGPGLILVGNIVGSGELIATPALGATAGYTFLWLILFSCFIKVFFQIEIGRYALSEQRTTLETMNTLPGPRAGVNWLLWYWLIMLIGSLIQMGAMCGGVAQALRIALPVFGSADRINDVVWAWIACGSVVLLLMVGQYRLIETFSLVLVTLFTLITLYSVGHLQFTPFACRWQDIVDGFSFRLPDDPTQRSKTIATALMAFGITGVGATELVAYPYWCLEKGYGKFVGPRTADDSWARRARGWIRVMMYDAWLCMLLFTVATVAFYILGAALIHPLGVVPEGTKMVETLKEMYAQTFGVYAKAIFLLGAFAVLYSTFFIATAANARMLADWFAVLKLYDPANTETRRLIVAVLCVVFPIFATSVYVYFEAPIVMVKISGNLQAMMLPLLGAGVLYFAHLRTDPRIRGGYLWYGILWLSYLLMSAVAIYGFYDLVTSTFFPPPPTNPA